MENLYGFHVSAGYSEHFSMACPSPPSTSRHAIPSLWTPQQFLRSDSSSAISDALPSAVADVQILDEDEVSKTLRDKIASHTLYPKIVDAYIDCQKVGATPEMVKLLDEIRRESNFLCKRSACLAADLELDDFMVTYCDLLVKFKLDLSRPFDEATTFLKDMEAQLNSLCNGPCRNNNPAWPDWKEGFDQLIYVVAERRVGLQDKATGSTEEDLSGEEREADEGKMINEDRELKQKLLRRYGGYITGLKHEFSKRKKKEKLPKEATQVLLAWWNIHRNWPYPTEEDKIALAEWTGLDQKQINNWFINQRKRHWKPSEDMQAAAAALDDLYGPFCVSD